MAFFALLLLSKVLGKNQITQLTPFDFISALVVGELLGNAIYDEDISLRYVLYAIFIWGSLIYTIEMLTQKFRITRGLLEGTPSVVIAKGRIQFKELKKEQTGFKSTSTFITGKRCLHDSRGRIWYFRNKWLSQHSA